MGRNPKLRAVEEREGNPGRRPIKEGTKLPPKLPPEPKWTEYFPVMSGPEAAKNKRARAQAHWFWKLYIDNMGPAGVVSLLDEGILRRAAVNWARLDLAERQISVEGITTEGERGMVKHAAITAVNAIDTRLLQQMRDLGMTPLSRDKLSPREDGDDDSDFDPSSHPRDGDSGAREAAGA